MRQSFWGELLKLAPHLMRILALGAIVFVTWRWLAAQDPVKVPSWAWSIPTEPPPELPIVRFQIPGAPKKTAENKPVGDHRPKPKIEEAKAPADDIIPDAVDKTLSANTPLTVPAEQIVSQIITAQQSEINGCFDRWKNERSATVVSVNLEFVVENMRLSAVRVLGDQPDTSAFGPCVAGLFASTLFESVTGAPMKVPVTVPLGVEKPPIESN